MKTKTEILGLRLTLLALVLIITAGYVAGQFSIPAGATYQINDVDVLSSTTLGSGVVSSSLTSVGTLSSGNATAIVDAATDTAAGKIEIATPAETSTGSDSTRALTPYGIKSNYPSLAYTNGLTLDAQTQINNIVGGTTPTSDWKNYATPPSYTSNDSDKIFTVTFSEAVDVDTGVRVRTQQYGGAYQYFILVKTNYPTNPTVWACYAGSDGADSIANATIDSIDYSSAFVPSGFPTGLNKWTERATYTSSTATAGTTALVWYNVGNFNLDVPTGIWDLSGSCELYTSDAAAVTVTPRMCVSLTADTCTDSELCVTYYQDVDGTTAIMPAKVSKRIEASAYTKYYLNVGDRSGNADSMQVWGAEIPSVIEAKLIYAP